ncbi:MAG: SDR family oxidoreductase [Rhodospirillaceae bacterium]|nr:SDR family oxidoreductase [Rhodospirillaceae bacterium]
MAEKSMLLLGATGGTGAQILEQALAAGHRVTVLARTPAKITTQHPNLRVVQGDMLEAARLTAAFDQPYDAVISALGVYLKNPGTTMTDGTKNIIAAMTAKGIKRLIVVSSVGASETKGIGPLWVRAVQHFILKNTLIDKTMQEQAIKDAGLDWTFIRPPRLMNGPKVGRYVTWTEAKPPKHLKLKWQVNRGDVAAEVLRSLDDPTTVGQAVQISDPA